MPLPLAVMIPFMAGQSFAMGEAFGKGFQYGKRRISAMTNEEFNAMSAKDHFEETTADISAMIPSMKAQMNNFSTLQTDIIKTLIEQLKDAGITVGEAVASGAGEVFAEGPIGGTAAAQSTLDTLRNYVGLPPLYSKLVDPTGLNALLNWWKSSGVISTFQFALNPSTWIFNEIKKIFSQSPTQNTVIDVLNFVVQSSSDPSIIGPPAPNDTPTDTEQSLIDAGVEPDLRSITSSSTVQERIIFFNSLPDAPSSVRTQWNKFVQELISLDSILSQSNTSVSNQQTVDDIKANIARVQQLMRDLKFKYNFGDNQHMGFSTMIST